MTRIAENQMIASVLQGIFNNRARVSKYSDEITTGLKVSEPGDSNLSGSISGFRELLGRIDGYKDRVSTVSSSLVFQDDVLKQAEELLIRAKEIATQAANSTNGDETRAHMAAEVFQIRDHLISLANSTYQGRYIYGGTADDTPPFIDTTYVNPATGQANLRYVHTGANGTGTSKTVKVTDDLSIVVNTPGDQIFNNAIYGLERLGRALEGFATNPAAGAPDGTGNPYVFPNDLETQTLDIRASLDILDTARETDILEERIDIGGRLRRLDTATSLLDLGKVNAEELIDKLQNADVVESASNLQQAEIALQASFTVSARVLNLTILDYI